MASIYMKGAQRPQPLGDVPIKITKIYDSTPSKKSKLPKKGNMKCLQYLPELNPPDPMDPTSLLLDTLKPLSASRIHHKTCTRIFIAGLSIRAENWT